MFFIKCN